MTVNDDWSVLVAFRQEADAFTAALGELPTSAWDQPTRCTPWQVRDVVGHVITVIARVPDMVAAPAPDTPTPGEPAPDTPTPGEPAPDTPDITATGYYRADNRFSSTANADRVRTARNRAAVSDVAGLCREFTETWQTVVALCEQQPAGRVVRTRHGDVMLLSEFLATRIVELAVHGLDVADAIPRQPWLTLAAAEHLQQMLFGSDWRSAVATTGWDPVTLLRKATGRAPITAEESRQLDRLGMKRLALG
ncbi:maleylpyruvate isomerase N-terminal domain-containing protein [Micromonospora sp. NPDC003197]